MIGVVTRGSRLSLFVSGITKKQSRKLIFCHNNSTRENFSRGYAVTHSDKKFVNNRFLSKKYLVPDKFHFESQRELSTEQ